jgi:hypothetical protein
MSETIGIKVSRDLVEEIRKLDPSLKIIPTTYIVDKLLRDLLEALKKGKP